MAQLVARFHGMEEVRGSNPLISTMKSKLKIPARWDTSAIPDLTGKNFLITGATSGLGLETAKALAAKNAQVTITARSAAKGEKALKQTGAQEFIELDLADLSSVHKAAKEVKKKYDVVFLNAGIMVPPFTKTVDGFESQMATNHLGHFAFTGLIAKQITGRVVVTSSFAHRLGNLGDGTKKEIENRIRGIGKYSPWGAYGDSKLANLLFVNELERMRVKNGGFIPVAAHPGWANTNLFAHDEKTNFFAQMGHLFGRIAQSASQGALPQLCAGTYAGISKSVFIGPEHFELRGHPKTTRAKSLAYDAELAANLWQVSESLTGVTWENSVHA